jgi:glycine oxidase
MAANSFENPDLTIVGGGVIGLAVAWRCAQRGMSVVVLERDRVGGGASHVAAGMLAPVAEVEFGEFARRALELGLASAELWPDFAAELERLTGVQVGLRPCGTLTVARDQDEASELERQLALRESLGLGPVRLRPSQARELEPALAPTIRLAMESPGDHSVDPRLVMQALRRACELEGVRLREHAPVTRVLLDGSGSRVAAVQLADEGPLACQRLLLAPGAWTSELKGLPPDARLPVRPVKGQIMRLRDPAGPGLLERVVRGAAGYLVPRGDGRYVLGATMEERGFDRHPTIGGIYELLRDACELVPGTSELEIEEITVGLRPTLPDSAPAVGVGRLGGLTWATGHFRNGILLAPLTADLLARQLAGGSPRELPQGALRAGVVPGELPPGWDPGRFAADEPPTGPQLARSAAPAARTAPREIRAAAQGSSRSARALPR